MPLIGERAPDFKLPDHNNEMHHLAQYLAKGPVLLAFYPGDFQPVCKRQLCAYQESLDRLRSYGVEILGISANTPEQHEEFRNEYAITFPLLSDHKRLVTKAYQITSLFLLGGSSRAVFILNRDGTVLYRHVEPTTITHRKPNELMQALEEMRASGRI